MTLCKELTTAFQTRLAQLGYYRLKVDGLDGPGTSEATIRFKEANGLRARDFVGPLTLTALFSPGATPWAPPAALNGEPPWLTEARALLGTRERPGKADNPVIMGWADNLDQWYPGDDVPWCGLFVAHCMSVGAPDEPQDFNRLGAREWLKYGEITRQELLGAVAVFWRGSRDGWQGHVGILTGHNATHIRIIGGNQSDNVTEAWLSRDRLLGLRVPEGADMQMAPRAPTGSLSEREN